MLCRVPDIIQFYLPTEYQYTIFQQYIHIPNDPVSELVICLGELGCKNAGPAVTDDVVDAVDGDGEDCGYAADISASCCCN